MDDIISKVDNQKISRINVETSTEDNEIKYYKCNEKNYTVQILEEDEDIVKDQEFILNTEETLFVNGEIVVTSVLDCGEREYLQGVKINLYKINGLSPILITSKITDEEGKVVFKEVEEGCYRIIEIIDKRYFEKPKYINWNEIIIDNANKNEKLIIINKIKRFVSQDKHKHWI